MLKKISSYAFTGCSSLREIVIPDSVENIAANTFHNCKNLIKVSVGRNTKIDEKAFVRAGKVRVVRR